VDCQPADVLWRLKTGYPPRDRDLLDFAALEAAFGDSRAGD
jgi:hypothetical protein